jgi:UDP-N-acetyl-D-mannosaminuronic acid dehydrogenase
LRLVVVGMGYVGIPSAALFADVEGIDVVGVQRRSDRSGWKIDYLNQGKCPIEGDEPGLSELIEKVVKKSTFRATDDTSVYKEANVILVDVQTPVDLDHVPRYESLKQVAQEIGEKMSRGAVIGVESTVAPGTTQHIVKPLLEEASGMKAGEDFNLVYSYERVMVGRLLHNLQYMPRIVGGHTAECARRGAELYRKIVKAEVHETDLLTAEIAKVAENAYRDVNIAFANEVALICESLGADVHEVRRYVNSLPYDPRDPAKNPYRMMMTPGAGVGGHCLPKDSWLLKYGVDKYGSFKVTPYVLVESRRINDYMPTHMRDLIIEALKQWGMRPENARVALLGYAFLEDSDDTRNTPALPLYRMLETLCREVIVHDPYVREEEDVNLTEDLEKAVMGRDCIALVTRHREYSTIDLNWLRDVMRTPIIVDGRNVFKSEEVRKAGFTFRGVGIGLPV